MAAPTARKHGQIRSKASRTSSWCSGPISKTPTTARSAKPSNKPRQTRSSRSPPMSLNLELSGLFHNFSALMELKGESVFKVIAFQKVGRILKEMNIDLRKCIEEGKLCDIEGIGKGSQQIIEEYVQTGRSTVFDEVAASVPAGAGAPFLVAGGGAQTPKPPGEGRA